MKKKVSKFFIVIIFLAGLSLLLYPFVANQWNNHRQKQLISSYEDNLTQMTEAGDIDYAKELKKAQAYNDALVPSILPDSFAVADARKEEDSTYMNCLNLTGDGMMGIVEIPKIAIKLPIYHGTSDEVLQQAAGHLEGSSLPIGGESTHCVVAAHRGLPSAKLFTDIDQLRNGDKFYIHVLDQILAYEVDQILPMVDKDDHETLENALKIEEGKDQVTLFTCTPYGVNSHRLLVRGTRVAYNGEEDKEATISESMVESIKNYYMIYTILGLAVTLLVILLLRYLSKKKKNKQPKE